MKESEALADLHSHLVPGVDDGARDLDDTLESVGRMVDVGITRIVTTPHYDVSLADHPRAMRERLAEIDEAFEEAREAVGGAYPDVEFLRGQEVMIDVPEPVLDDPRLHLGDTNYVLIEWPRMQIPPRTEHVVEKIVSDGYRPIIAHPERYFGMNAQLDLLLEWRRLGALLQVNHGSLAGRFGKEAHLLAAHFVARGVVDCLSTDFHARPHLELFVRESKAWFENRGALEAFHTLAGANVRRVLEGQDTLPVPAVKEQPGFWKRVRGMLGATHD